MTLSNALDLDMVQVDLHVKFLVRMFSQKSADRCTHTDGTDGTSTADTGDKKNIFKSSLYGFLKYKH